MTLPSQSVIKHAFERLPLLEYAARSLISYRMLIERAEDEATKNSFWRTTATALLGDALINWSHLFGRMPESEYWRSITFEQKAFRDLVYNKCNFTYQKLFEYRSQVSSLGKRYRDGAIDSTVLRDKIDLAIAEEILLIAIDWCRDINMSEGIGAKEAVLQTHYVEQIRGQVKNVLEYNFTPDS